MAGFSDDEFGSPDEWKTGDEPATEAQKSYIAMLAAEAGEDADELDDLTKAQAAEWIEELRERTGRGNEG